MFALFHTLRIVLNVEEFSTLEKRKRAKEKGCEWLQYWTIIAAAVSHLLLQINSSINFVIYCYFNKSFRYELSSWLNRIVVFFKKDTREVEKTLPDVRVDSMPLEHRQEIAIVEEVEQDEPAELDKNSNEIEE